MPTYSREALLGELAEAPGGAPYESNRGRFRSNPCHRTSLALKSPYFRLLPSPQRPPRSSHLPGSARSFPTSHSSDPVVEEQLAGSVRQKRLMQESETCVSTAWPMGHQILITSVHESQRPVCHANSETRGCGSRCRVENGNICFAGRRCVRWHARQPPPLRHLPMRATRRVVCF